MLLPLHTDASEPALSTGTAFTVMTTVLVEVHPDDVIFSVNEYVVVVVGLTLGLALVEVNPLGEEVQL